MIVGGYTLDLYCDKELLKHEGDRASYYGQTAGECRKQARREGWKFRGDRVYCLNCKAPVAPK